MHSDARSVSKSGNKFPKSIKIKLWMGDPATQKHFFLPSGNPMCNFQSLTLMGNDYIGPFLGGFAGWDLSILRLSPHKQLTKALVREKGGKRLTKSCYLGSH